MGLPEKLLADASPALPRVDLVDSGPGYVRLLFRGPELADLSPGSEGNRDPSQLPVEYLRHYSSSALVGVPLEGDAELIVIEAHTLGQAVGEVPADLRWDGPAWVEDPAYLRHQRVVAIGFGPNAEGTAGATVYDRVLVELRFPAAEGRVSAFDGFESSYRATIVNYDQARRWRRAPRVTGAARRTQSEVLPEEGMFRLTVRSNGLYRVSGKDLEVAGADLKAIDPDRIRLLYAGGLTLGLSTRVSAGTTLREMPVVVDDGGDGRFDGDDAILFYGEGVERWDYSILSGYFWRKNLYTKDNIYWIDLAGATAGIRAEERSGATDRLPDGVIEQYRERVHEEDERLILRQLEGINSGYDWYWEVFNGNARNFTFVVNDAVSGIPASVRVAFFGWTNEAHLFDLFWNGDDLGRKVFNKSPPDTITAVAADGATEGLNQLGLFHRDQHTTRLDWYEVDYVRRLVARGGELNFDWPVAGDGGIDNAAASTVGQFQLAGFAAADGVPRVFSIAGDLQEIVDFDYDPTTGAVLFQDSYSGTGRLPRYIASQPTRWKRPAAIVRDPQQRLRNPANRADLVLITHGEFMPASRRLAEWRAIDDRFGPPLQVMLVDVQDIYDEFSGGLLDPMAIRAFAKYAIDNWAVPPVYFTLMGDGTYDYKNNSGVSHTNWIPPYQDGESTYDEWYVRTEGLDRIPDAAIGRLPVQSLDEAEALVDKIIAYDRDPETGPWQTRALLVADDIFNPQVPNQYEAFFIIDAEFMAMGDMPPDLDMTKLYIGSYQLEGRTKPKARDEFLRLLNKGVLVLTYLGHGNPEVLAHEQIFLLSRDIGSVANGRRLPFIYTAASQVGVFDDPSRESMPETMVKKPDGGAIGFISATRVGFHNSNVLLARRFHRQMYRSHRDHVPMGLALMEAKQIAGISDENRTNIQRYSLIGDPAQRLNRPRLTVALQIPDTLEALMEVDVTGQVLGQDGTVRSDYQGEALVRAFDSSAESEIEGLPYEQLGAPIFRARVPVANGRFNTRFRVPKDITYRASQGRISAYVIDSAAVEPAFGSRTELVLEGTAATAGTDGTGPTIAVAFAGQAGFRTGDFVSPRATLAAVLSDPSGINITGETGHEIELWIDDAQVMAVTEFFTALTDHTQGVVEFSLGTLEPGEHTIRLKVWDTFNNSAVEEASFVVAEAADAALTGVLFHPNPTTDGTGHFIYTLTAASASVRIQVFALSGRRVADVDGDARLGYNQVAWTPARELANGTYFYRLGALLESGETVEHDGWVQVLR